jgi:putative hemolysin
VQIGVTLAGFFSASVGAVTLSQPVADLLRGAGMASGWAQTVALTLVTVVIAYASLVLGELAPKRLALQRAEGLARLAAPPIEALARGTRPVIWLLGRSSDLVVRLFGGDPKQNREVVTEQELRDLVATNQELSPDERALISQVLDAGDRPVREIMVPRLDVSALQMTLTVAEAVAATADLPYSRYPVVDGGLDDVVGFVHIRDLVTAHRTATAAAPPPPLPPLPSRPLLEVARPLMRMPDTRRALPALAEMRRERVHLAVVVDEYGGSAGIVTLEDLIEELVGDITDEFDVHLAGSRSDREHRQHRDGHGWSSRDGDAPGRDHDGGYGPDGRDGGDGGVPALPTEPVNAQLRLDEFAEETGLALPDGPYDTAAGWLVIQLGRIPEVGDHADLDDDIHGRVRITVDHMRGRRVDRVSLHPLPDEPELTATTAGDQPEFPHPPGAYQDKS